MAEDHPFHHASEGPIVCRDCPGWREYRCVEAGCDCGGPTEPLYKCEDGALRCWRHRQLWTATSTLFGAA